MTNKVLDITVILPVHELNGQTEKMFQNAVKSVEEQTERPNLLVVASSSAYAKVSELVKGVENCKVVKNEGETDFASQIDFGVKNITTKWFSILEFDDEYSKIWFKNVKKYSEIYNDVDAFMPIVVDIDNKSVFAGFTNEATFAANFSQEMEILVIH